MSIDLRYKYITHHTAKIDNVNITLNEKIDSYSAYFDDVEEMENINKDDLISIFLDFILETRLQANILHDIKKDFEELGNLFLKDGQKKNSVAFKAEMIKHRY